MIQERLRARRHLRVMTCGRHTWTCELGADALPLDWRSDEDAHGGFVPTREPAVEAWALSLASELGVGYSSQDWIDDGETPLCPRCGVDAVMIGVTDLAELLTMHRIRFRRPLDPKFGSATDTPNDN